MDFSTVRANLEKHRFTVSCFADRESAARHLEKSITGETVGFGGSMTVRELNLFERLGKNNTVYWHWIDASARDRYAEFTTYVCSANAVTQGGELVNIDGTGNRIAATVYGPKKVYFVVGKNKICPDLASAEYRIRNVVSPLNAKRLGFALPCAADGKCHDCDSPERMCAVMAVHMRPLRNAEHTEVVLVDEDLGY